MRCCTAPDPATTASPSPTALTSTPVPSANAHARVFARPTDPRIIGHELGVTVVAVGEGVENVQPGDRCSVEPYYNCGACVACKRGRGNCCSNISVIGVHEDGGMRGLFLAPARKLHRSETLSLEQLALVETLCIGAHAVARAAVEAGENVLVIGAGPVGMGTAQFAKAAGGNVVVMDVVEERLAFIREQVGVEHTVNARGPFRRPVSPSAATVARSAEAHAPPPACFAPIP